jgi:hypothetical protein
MYRRLGGPQGWPGQVWKISPPPGFDPRTIQPVASRYNDAILAHEFGLPPCVLEKVPLSPLTANIQYVLDAPLIHSPHSISLLTFHLIIIFQIYYNISIINDTTVYHTLIKAIHTQIYDPFILLIMLPTL